MSSGPVAHSDDGAVEAAPRHSAVTEPTSNADQQTLSPTPHTPGTSKKDPPGAGGETTTNGEKKATPVPQEEGAAGDDADREFNEEEKVELVREFYEMLASEREHFVEAVNNSPQKLHSVSRSTTPAVADAAQEEAESEGSAQQRRAHLVDRLVRMEVENERLQQKWDQEQQQEEGEEGLAGSGSHRHPHHGDWMSTIVDGVLSGACETIVQERRVDAVKRIQHWLRYAAIPHKKAQRARRETSDAVIGDVLLGACETAHTVRVREDAAAGTIQQWVREDVKRIRESQQRVQQRRQEHSTVHAQREAEAARLEREVAANTLKHTLSQHVVSSQAKREMQQRKAMKEERHRRLQQEAELGEIVYELADGVLESAVETMGKETDAVKKIQTWERQQGQPKRVTKRMRQQKQSASEELQLQAEAMERTAAAVSLLKNMEQYHLNREAVREMERRRQEEERRQMERRSPTKGLHVPPSPLKRREGDPQGDVPPRIAESQEEEQEWEYAAAMLQRAGIGYLQRVALERLAKDNYDCMCEEMDALLQVEDIEQVPDAGGRKPLVFHLGPDEREANNAGRDGGRDAEQEEDPDGTVGNATAFDRMWCRSPLTFKSLTHRRQWTFTELELLDQHALQREQLWSKYLFWGWRVKREREMTLQQRGAWGWVRAVESEAMGRLEEGNRRRVELWEQAAWDALHSMHLEAVIAGSTSTPQSGHVKASAAPTKRPNADRATDDEDQGGLQRSMFSPPSKVVFGGTDRPSPSRSAATPSPTRSTNEGTLRTPGPVLSRHERNQQKLRSIVQLDRVEQLELMTRNDVEELEQVVRREELWRNHVVDMGRILSPPPMRRNNNNGYLTPRQSSSRSPPLSGRSDRSRRGEEPDEVTQDSHLTLSVPRSVHTNGSSRPGSSKLTAGMQSVTSVSSAAGGPRSVRYDVTPRGASANGSLAGRRTSPAGSSHISTTTGGGAAAVRRVAEMKRMAAADVRADSATLVYTQNMMRTTTLQDRQRHVIQAQRKQLPPPRVGSAGVRRAPPSESGSREILNPRSATPLGEISGGHPSNSKPPSSRPAWNESTVSSVKSTPHGSFAAVQNHQPPTKLSPVPSNSQSGSSGRPPASPPLVLKASQEGSELDADATTSEAEHAAAAVEEECILPIPVASVAVCLMQEVAPLLKQLRSEQEYLEDAVEAARRGSTPMELTLRPQEPEGATPIPPSGQTTAGEGERNNVSGTGEDSAVDATVIMSMPPLERTKRWLQEAGTAVRRQMLGKAHRLLKAAESEIRGYETQRDTLAASQRLDQSSRAPGTSTNAAAAAGWLDASVKLQKLWSMWYKKRGDGRKALQHIQSALEVHAKRRAPAMTTADGPQEEESDTVALELQATMAALLCQCEESEECLRVVVAGSARGEVQVRGQMERAVVLLGAIQSHEPGGDPPATAEQLAASIAELENVVACTIALLHNAALAAAASRVKVHRSTPSPNRHPTAGGAPSGAEQQRLCFQYFHAAVDVAEACLGRDHACTTSVKASAGYLARLGPF